VPRAQYPTLKCISSHCLTISRCLDIHLLTDENNETNLTEDKVNGETVGAIAYFISYNLFWVLFHSAVKRTSTTLFGWGILIT